MERLESTLADYTTLTGAPPSPDLDYAGMVDALRRSDPDSPYWRSPTTVPNDPWRTPYIYKVHEGHGRSYVLYSAGRDQIDNHLTGDDLSTRGGIPRDPYETRPHCGPRWQREPLFLWSAIGISLVALFCAALIGRLGQPPHGATQLHRASRWALAGSASAAVLLLYPIGIDGVLFYTRAAGLTIVAICVAAGWLQSRDRGEALAPLMIAAAWVASIAMVLCMLAASHNLWSAALSLHIVALIFLITGFMLRSRGDWTTSLAVLLVFATASRLGGFFLF